jgi:hypothetical protein
MLFTLSPDETCLILAGPFTMTGTRHVLMVLVGLLAALDAASAMIEGLYCGKDNCYDGLFFSLSLKT